jgi:hypothetical protein
MQTVERAEKWTVAGKWAFPGAVCSDVVAVEIWERRGILLKCLFCFRGYSGRRQKF